MKYISSISPLSCARLSFCAISYSLLLDSYRKLLFTMVESNYRHQFWPFGKTPKSPFSQHAVVDHVVFYFNVFRAVFTCIVSSHTDRILIVSTDRNDGQSFRTKCGFHQSATPNALKRSVTQRNVFSFNCRCCQDSLLCTFSRIALSNIKNTNRVVDFRSSLHLALSESQYPS